MSWASRSTLVASMLVLCAHGCQWITGASERDLAPGKPTCDGGACLGSGGDSGKDSSGGSGGEAGRDSGSDSGNDSETPTDSGALCDGGLALDDKGNCQQKICGPDAQVVSIPDPDDVPSDEPCRHGQCIGSVPALANQPPGTPCEGGFCNEAGICITQCNNTMQDGDEVDVDCGGAKCPRCDDGKTCKADGDCVSGMCNVCTSPVECDFCNSNCQDATCGPPPHLVEGACAVILWRDGVVVESQSTPTLCDTNARRVQLRPAFDTAYAYLKHPPNNELAVTATFADYRPRAWYARCVGDFGTRQELVAAIEAFQSLPDWVEGSTQPDAGTVQMSFSCATAALYKWTIDLPALK